MSTFIYSSLLAKKFLSMCLARPGLQLKKRKVQFIYLFKERRERTSSSKNIPFGASFRNSKGYNQFNLKISQILIHHIAIFTVTVIKQ